MKLSERKSRYAITQPFSTGSVSSGILTRENTLNTNRPQSSSREKKKDLGTGKDGTTNYHNGRGWVRVTKKAGHSECGQKRYRIQFEGKIVLSLSKKKNSNISVMSSMTLSITSSQS